MDRTFELGCHSCHATSLNALKRPLYAVGNRVKEQLVRAAASRGEIRRVYGPADVECARDELVVLCVERNAALWIRSFIEHHLELGARHIFFLDTGSTDDTISLASTYDCVSVFSTELSFKQLQIGLRRWLTRTLGRDRWSVTCDADELWDYPYSDRLNLRFFLQYLNRHGYKTVTAHMIDMFSGEPFNRLQSRPDDSLKDKYRFYDLTNVIRTRDVYWMHNGQSTDEHIFCTFGGIRHRHFGSRCLLQTKHPLVFADDSVGVYTYDGHFMTDAPVADITTALLHYKFVSSLAELAKTNLEEGQLYHASQHYQGFRDVLASEPDFSLLSETSSELGRVQELVDSGFLTVSERFVRWADEAASAHD